MEVRVLSFAQLRIPCRIRRPNGRRVAAVLRTAPSDCPNCSRARLEHAGGSGFLRPGVAVQRGDLLVPHQVGGAREIARGGQLGSAAVAEVVGGEGRREVRRKHLLCGLAQLRAVVVSAEDETLAGRHRVQGGPGAAGSAVRPKSGAARPRIGAEPSLPRMDECPATPHWPGPARPRSISFRQSRRTRASTSACAL